MFCPSCGFESTQKTNFCKRCGTNMSPAGNLVEIQMPKPRVMGMTITITAFSLIGLIATIVGIEELSNGLPVREPLIVAFLGCLAFIFSIAGILVWQLSRLISVYQEAVRQTIHKAQFEPVAPPQPTFPQAQPVYVPAPQEVVQNSVTEHTTRQMAIGHQVSRTGE